MVVVGLLIGVLLVIILVNVLSVSREVQEQARILENIEEKIRDLKKTFVAEAGKPAHDIMSEEARYGPKAKEEPAAPPVETSTEPTLSPEIVDEEPVVPLLQEPIETPKPASKPQPVRTAAPVTPKIHQPSFFERHPDLEKFIGENLMSKIGIVILVLGIAYFVKFAIDNNWINEVGRVAIGFLCGGILIAVAHRLRKTFRTFSSILSGGGLAVFYFTVVIAFHQYHIFSQTVAFILMVVITGFSVFLSVLYDKKELAVFALLGGFASPLMVSNGEGNYIILFTYLLILNIGLLVLSYYKRWTIIQILSFIGTVLMFVMTLATLDVKHLPGLLFLTAYYLIFLAVTLINNHREIKSFPLMVWFVLANNIFYYSAGMYILSSYHNGMLQGLFTLLNALINFGVALYVKRNATFDMKILYLLIGIVLSLVILAVPIQLKGNYITLFWSAEFVLLLWLSQRTGYALLKLGSFIVMGLSAISLVLDWTQLYGWNVSFHPVVLNKAFITGMCFVAALACKAFLLKNDKAETYLQVPSAVYRSMIFILIGLFAYSTGAVSYTHLDVYKRQTYAPNNPSRMRSSVHESL